MNKKFDYEEIGFKCGLEIHQQLDTNKLFCNCSTEMEQNPIGTVERKLNVVKGEMGQVDPAALHETLKNKIFTYQYFPKESCEVELDEEPPHEVNKSALETALQIAKILNCDIPDEIYPMRKTVIDGSNTSGFQRTMLIGLNGALEIGDRKIDIENICLEEESSQIVKKDGNNIHYSINRLGIPLVEIGTGPDIARPEEITEVAKKIGDLLRSTRSVKRGIGTIRQDVNISIEDGARIEIKGVQELDLMQKAAVLETERQTKLLEIKDELNNRDAKINKETKDVKDILKNTDSSIGQKLLDKKYVKSFKLEGFKGTLAKKITGEKTFGAELADYVKALGLGGIIHTDEDIEKYKLKPEFDKLKKKHSAGENDVIVVIAGDDKTNDAIETLFKRLEKAFEGVPEETRTIQEDGTSKYTRPLPGEARMYPETDVPPLHITKKYINQIEIPKTIQERKQELIKKFKLSEHLATELLESEFYDLFLEIEDELKLKNKTIATVLTTDLKDIKKRYGAEISKLSGEDMIKVLKELDSGSISREAVPKIITHYLQNEDELVDLFSKYSKMDLNKLRDIIKQVIDEKKDIVDDDRALKKLMGPVMSEVEGKFDGKKVAEELKNELARRKE